MRGRLGAKEGLEARGVFWVTGVNRALGQSGRAASEGATPLLCRKEQASVSLVTLMLGALSGRRRKMKHGRSYLFRE